MTWNEIGIIVVMCLAISVFAHWVVWAILSSFIDDFLFLYTPGTLYFHTKMNWFGCIAVYILLFPFGFVFEIGGFLKWLFTVGRKD